MKPEIDRVLEVASAHLMMKTAPALQDGYEQASAMSLAVLMMAVREENDRAAARRVEENAALRALFGEAADVVEDDALCVRLRELAATRDESLRVSDLESANGVLRELLIELHARVEQLESRDASRIVGGARRLRRS